MMPASDPYGDREWLQSKKTVTPPSLRVFSPRPSTHDDPRAYRGVQAIDGRTWNGERFEP